MLPEIVPLAMPAVSSELGPLTTDNTISTPCATRASRTTFTPNFGVRVYINGMTIELDSI